MNSYLFIIGSYTQAMKASDILVKYGFKVKAEKINTQNGGCGFGIRIFENPAGAYKILSQYGIAAKRV